ncbi:hypothetical protein N8D56_06420 [Devosia sp. A8/3-2]|nr:hypothetical protein N8D56_06420 [Devosia sp. A8/3-2]
MTRSPQLPALQAADTTAIESHQTAAQRRASEQAAIKARGEAINGAVTGLFGGLGNVFGGGKDADVVPVMSGKIAPIPAIRP